MIRQLKPYKDSFYTFVYSGVKSLTHPYSVREELMLRSLRN